MVKLKSEIRCGPGRRSRVLWVSSDSPYPQHVVAPVTLLQPALWIRQSYTWLWMVALKLSLLPHKALWQHHKVYTVCFTNWAIMRRILTLMQVGLTLRAYQWLTWNLVPSAGVHNWVDFQSRKMEGKIVNDLALLCTCSFVIASLTACKGRMRQQLIN